MTDPLLRMKTINTTNHRAAGGKNARRGFSLAELIIAIALLSIFGVIAARMFFVSDGLSKRTAQLDQAVVLASNIAEVWQGYPAEGMVQEPDQYTVAGFRAEEFISDLEDGRKWQTMLDSELNPTMKGTAAFVLTTTLEQTEVQNVWQLYIEISAADNSSALENDSLIFDLTASRYFRTEVAEQ